MLACEKALHIIVGDQLEKSRCKNLLGRHVSFLGVDGVLGTIQQRTVALVEPGSGQFLSWGWGDGNGKKSYASDNGI